MKKPLPIIGAESKFYGYITGIGIEHCPDPCVQPIPATLYATFEYGGETTVWVVPDHELFGILARHLADMAVMRHEHGDYGYAKLWIGKKDGRWDVDLP